MNEELMRLKMKILEAREKRVTVIRNQLNSSHVILSLRANYPGDYKDVEVTRTLISTMDGVVNQTFNIISWHKLNCGEGLVYIYQIASSDPKQVKEASIQIENTHPLGRLIDLDVYYKNEQSKSRHELGYKPRTCFLCDDVAFKCIRSKKHSVDELTSYIHRVVKQYEQRGFQSKNN